MRADNISYITTIKTDGVQTDDKVFFKKDRIKPGVELICYGRRQPYPTKWHVKRLLHYYIEAPSHRNYYKETWRYHKLDEPKNLDTVAVLKSEHGATMELTISYLSYSAIWRLS